MRIRIVLAPQNAGWVIGKIAHRLRDGVRQLGHEVEVSAEPDSRAEVNHWMSFAFADGCRESLNTMFVTHADDPFKVSLIRERLNGPIQLALCMSRHAAEELSELRIPADRLWYVLPAVDAPIPARRICIGITTRVYDDGRKREAFLVRLAQEMRLDAFHFDVFGAGWEKVLPVLERAGAAVRYDPGSEDWAGDYTRIRAAIPSFDYYLYLGIDEGSLGTLDAVSAGVKTIVTAQGFHLSIPGGITHPFTEYEQLRGVFRQLGDESATAASRVSGWTWEAYAREHVGVWEAMVRHCGSPVPHAELLATQVRDAGSAGPSLHEATRGRIASGRWSFYARTLEPARIRGAIARLRWLQPLRKLIGH